jgi:hypothetical protein
VRYSPFCRENVELSYSKMALPAKERLRRRLAGV